MILSPLEEVELLHEPGTAHATLGPGEPYRSHLLRDPGYSELALQGGFVKREST